uniref:EndoU domain-containing protein n=1 Tax=Grammatophora oceanica TaxID=210454 RepID=A0A7S1Y3M7_9STRA|eukprot:CAMPEP_0194043488 /NCGR_PEP_ID=MMETSP0009_2-20130614/15095_1 /TAXON_ID=210454 /ORGANISM="Grammatophora oceanica, Strain CCMP 410" /LENGTH=483 /DNA_ID=CAMNT_0038687703 /DNA_START=15 /DNA_END=1466 /DNA_ORIENTATION=+
MTYANPMDQKIETFYRQIFADLKVDQGEAQALQDFFNKTNPPPDKIVWLRATAFRIGCEFLQDSNDHNVALLRAINAIVHAVETARMQPKPLEGTDKFDDDKVSEYFTSILEDLSVDRDENQELFDFFTTENPPPPDKIIYTRASAFRIASGLLTDDKATNTQLLRCVNVLVHAFEQTCLMPKPYVLQQPVPPTISVEAVGVDASIEKAVQHLWDLDNNRLHPNEDYVINVQRGKKPWQNEDSARQPLFTKIDTKVLRRPTYKAFLALLDNYVAETGVAENVTDTERREIWTFLKAIMQTGPMQFCHKYCKANATRTKVPSDTQGFMKLLHKVWFDLYRRSRGGRDDSSGFEHVFVGEIKDDKVSGFHNWIQLYLEEKKGALNYKGYIKPKSRDSAATNEDDHILTIQFDWNGVEKSVGTSFIGTSPEFEFALYTTCFLVGQEQNRVTLDTGDDVFDLNIKCFTMARDKIGTSFPEAVGHWEE